MFALVSPNPCHALGFGALVPQRSGYDMQELIPAGFTPWGGEPPYIVVRVVSYFGIT